MFGKTRLSIHDGGVEDEDDSSLFSSGPRSNIVRIVEYSPCQNQLAD